MTELEKCMAGEDYNCHDQIFLDFKSHARKLLQEYNALAYEQKEEKEEIISFNDTPDNNLKVIRTFAESWKKKDASLIEPYITSDFIYSSQWVLEGIKGKGEYINYLSGKFDTIKNTHSNIKVAIVPNKNSIFLCQDNNQTCVLQIDVQHGMAHSAIMCFPDLCNLIDLNDD